MTKEKTSKNKLKQAKNDRLRQITLLSQPQAFQAGYDLKKYAIFSDVYVTYYPYMPHGDLSSNPGATGMLTLEQLQEMNVTASYVCIKTSFITFVTFMIQRILNFQPPVKSIRVEDIFKVIDTEIIVMKIDIETYECKVIKFIYFVYERFESSAINQ